MGGGVCRGPFALGLTFTEHLKFRLLMSNLQLRLYTQLYTPCVKSVYLLNVKIKKGVASVPQIIAGHSNNERVSNIQTFPDVVRIAHL